MECKLRAADAAWSSHFHVLRSFQSMHPSHSSGNYYIISARSEVGMHDVDNHAIEWVPESYWEPSKKFEESMLGDAEQQLQGKPV